MSLGLASFAHPGLNRLQFWDGKHFSTHIRPFTDLIEEPKVKLHVEKALLLFEREVYLVPYKHTISPYLLNGFVLD